MDSLSKQESTKKEKPLSTLSPEMFTGLIHTFGQEFMDVSTPAWVGEITASNRAASASALDAETSHHYDEK